MDWKGLIDFEEVPTVNGIELLSKLADEWDALSEKTSPISADLLLIEDSADSGNKKKIEIGNITPSDLNITSQAQGDILYFNGTNWVRLAAGTNGYFLKTNGTGANPAWALASSFKEYLFQADQFESPNSSDWAVNALAPVTPGQNTSLTIRRFDDTTAEGVGFTCKIPTGATNIIFDFLSRAATAPGSTQAVALNLYRRGIPDNAAVSSWTSAYALTNISIPNNGFYQEDTQTIALSTLTLTAGRMHQFELTRNAPAGGDTLTGDWCLHSIRVRFS